MRTLRFAALILVCSASPVFGQSELAMKFGARESISDISLSPDGKRIAFLAPLEGRATGLYVANADGSTPAKMILTSDAAPLRLTECDWVSNTRLICDLFGLTRDVGIILGFTRLIAINDDGKEIKSLANRSTTRSLGINQFSGSVIGWPPGDTGDVIMTRQYIPESTIDTRLASSKEGLGVDLVNTLTLKSKRMAVPRKNVSEYLADTNGDVRIMGIAATFDDGTLKGTTNYLYRPIDSERWKVFSTSDGEGMVPVAVDAQQNIAFSYGKKDGRQALFTVKLDDSLASELVLAHEEVDIGRLITIGRSRRVIGVDIVTDKRETVFIDPTFKALAQQLSKALPGEPLIRFIDASRDENQLLVFTGTDLDPGSYYIFDRTAKRLNKIFAERLPLETVKLAPVKPISYPASDGTMIPGYLTLPVGSAGKGLPTIIMPHGGPASRDEWGFDWIAQYFAALGYAVLQPNFRGSAGYGDDWYVDNGFKSWRIAVGDVNDAAKWMIAQGTADRSKMAVFGWSYGGYAALQSSVLDPDLFKAIVAVAPVTDLARLKDDSRGFTNFGLVSDYIGTGEHIVSGSPRRQAKSIKAPVLMFSGDIDATVDISQAKAMDSALKENGKESELITYQGLDHSLVDSTARADMLQRSSDFFKRILGVP
jgi:dipeptidyl aminopeptidase/acylaminoacyl peptidase